MHVYPKDVKKFEEQNQYLKLKAINTRYLPSDMKVAQPI